MVDLPSPSSSRWLHLALAGSGLVALVILWDVGLRLAPGSLLPTPWEVVKGIVELAMKGRLVRDVVASLFRVSWGYVLAVALAIPSGLALGWFRRGELAVSPLIQVFRPISPLAWIPIAILWCGVGDLSAIFIIFVATFWPVVVATMNAVRNVHLVHLQAARNFGLTPAQTLWRVVLPATLPQLIVGLRLALGIAWLVDVAAEMIAVNSGLGFLIVDARNAGNRYDLVVAGMVLIGAVGFTLDTAMRSLETTLSSTSAPAARPVSQFERRRFIR